MNTLFSRNYKGPNSLIVRTFFVIAFLVTNLFCVVSQSHAFVNEDRISFSKSLAHYALGQTYDRLGLTNRATLEYEKALQFDEGSSIINLRLGTDYARLDMIPQAIEQLQLVSKKNPKDLQSHYLLALIYSTQKDYDKAAQEYEVILKAFAENEPENVEIYSYLAQLYYSQKKYDEAIGQFQKILSIEPKNADIMYLLGSLYLEVKQDNKAIDVLKKSIEVDPEHDGSLNTLGYIYAEKNINLEQAESLVKQALAIDPKNAAYLDSLGWVYYKKGEYEKAIEVLAQANEMLRDPVILDHLGDVYFKMNKTEDALKNWRLSLELLPDQASIKQKISDVINSQASR